MVLSARPGRIVLDELIDLPRPRREDHHQFGALVQRLKQALLPADAQGNTGHGATLAVDSTGNLLFSDAGTIAVLGVEGLVVVRTGDTVLVMPKARSQEVRRIVNELAARGRGELL